MTCRIRHTIAAEMAHACRMILVALLVACLSFAPAMPGVSAAWAQEGGADVAAAASDGASADKDASEDKDTVSGKGDDAVAEDDAEQGEPQEAAEPSGDEPMSDASNDGAASAEDAQVDVEERVGEDPASRTGDDMVEGTLEEALADAADTDDAADEAADSSLQPGASAESEGQKAASIHEVRFSYQRVRVGGDGSFQTEGKAISCTGDTVPAIESLDGRIILKALVVFEDADGALRECDAADAAADLKWEIVESRDKEGNATAPLARVKGAENGSRRQDCLIEALGAGDGTVKVRCKSSAYPDWAGKSITVNISGNAVVSTAAKRHASASTATMATQAVAEGKSPVSATLLYRNSLTGEFEEFTGTTPPKTPARVVVSSSGATFDVLITYDDGSTARASEAGVAVSWSLSNATYAGATVATIDAAGKLTLSGVSTKLVQLNAKVGDLDVERCPAYINLVGEVAVPDSGTAISSMAISFESMDTGEDGRLDPATADSLDIPAIQVVQGELLFTSTVNFIDASGAVSSATGSTANARLVWQLVAFYDVLGIRSNVITAGVQAQDQGAVLSALRSGDGWAILRCASLEYPEFVGQEVLVRIQNNQAVDASVVAANTVTGAQLVYRDEQTGEYLTYSGFTRFTTPTVIDEPYGSVSFDVRLAFQDGSTALAGERGLAVDWRLSGHVDTARNLPIAQMAANGTLSATRVKNNVVSISRATVNGIEADGTTAYVRITNNGYAEPVSGGLAMSAVSNYWLRPSQSPDDSSQKWRWSPSFVGPTTTYTVPLCVSNMASDTSCYLSAGVNWSDGTLTVSDALDHAGRTWSIVSSVDLEGRHASNLATVVNGFVRPTGRGSGYVTVRCDANVPYYDADGNKQVMQASGIYRVAIYVSQGYVEKVELLGEDGSVLSSSVKLPDGKNTYHFSARITYREYDGSTGSLERRVVVVPTDTPTVDDLEWSVSRNENRQEAEAYSTIRQDGSFLAQSGFARGYVYVNLKKASFTGGDIGAGVTVIAEDSIDPLGRVDAMKVLIFHHSDYEKEGKNAPVAKELVLTRAQLEARADYTTWYTFQRRGDSFATLYAHGVTMQSLLALCGVPANVLESMVFTGNDGVSGIVHSADFILGTQYRYTNYYYHKTLPGLVHGQSVAPMLALSYYMKNNAGYEDKSDKNNAGDAGFGMMGADSTLRVIFGMRGVNVNNANQSIYKVTQIVMVVADNTFPPDEEEEDPKEDPKEDPNEDESGDSIPTQGDDPDADSSGDAGGNGESNNPFSGQSDEGTGTDSRHGGEVAVAEGGEPSVGAEDATNDENDDEGAHSGESTEVADDSLDTNQDAHAAFARELKERPQVVVPPAKIGIVWWVGTFLASLLALLIGAFVTRRRFVVDKARGALIHT